MDFNQVIYQIYPLGFCGAPKENDHILSHRILKVLEWIPHFQKLGITAVLFNPVFASDRHGYDTDDFARIDCRLGTNEDFKKVCDALHEKNIKVILDGVFNHVGRGFGYFQDVIKKRDASPYKDWFICNFNDPNGPDGFYYEGWEGHQELVKLNLQQEEVRRYLLERADQWIAEFGIDGLRLDVAYMVDRSFMHELCNHIRSYDPEFFFLGEMIGGDYNELMKDSLLDSVTNYECRKGLYSSMNSHNLFEIGYSLNRQFGNDQWCLYQGKHLLSFTDNHDVNRLASELEDDKDLPLTYALMYAMPGIPCIYYGSEWGAEGKRTDWSDDALRPCFANPEWNTLTDLLAELDTLRKNYAIFTDGDYKQIYLQNEQMIFRRRNDAGQLTFAINISDQPVHIDFDAEVENGIDLYAKKKVNFQKGIDLKQKSFCFYYTDWIKE
jgi:glycosidase